MALEFIKLVKGNSPVAQVGSLGFFKLGVESSGGGGDLDRVFGNNTPEQIAAVSAEISANNMTSAQVAETYGWNIGDTIDITLTTGEAIQMRIIGFNHDDKIDGGKAGITLEMINCLNTAYIMRNDGTNYGGWAGSIVSAILKDTVKPTLPIEWQNVIKTVYKNTADGGGSNFTGVYAYKDDLFLLSLFELSSGTGGQAATEEGSQYEYWVGKSDADRIKTVGGNAYYWWTRTCATNTTRFRVCNSSGGVTTATGNTGCGVSFAFCV